LKDSSAKTYNMLMGMLNPTHSVTIVVCVVFCKFASFANKDKIVYR